MPRLELDALGVPSAVVNSTKAPARSLPPFLNSLAGMVTGSVFVIISFSVWGLLLFSPDFFTSTLNFFTSFSFLFGPPIVSFLQEVEPAAWGLDYRVYVCYIGTEFSKGLLRDTAWEDRTCEVCLYIFYLSFFYSLVNGVFI